MQSGIPKRIHYCWFGGAPIPELTKKCIETWKKYCPDYEIMQWNETNFDINCCTYVKEAYKSKKWAFVTDYVRLFALNQYGGIYLDTDVEIVKNFDEFLDNQAFIGFEDDEYLSTGVMASRKGNEWIAKLLQGYNGRRFLLENGYYDVTTNVIAVTNITKKNYSLCQNNQNQNLKDVMVYSREYFSPKDYDTGKLVNYTSNTVAIHHFNGSWVSEEERNLDIKSGQIREKYGVIPSKIYRNTSQFLQAFSKGGIKEAKNLFSQKMHLRKRRKEV